MNLQGKLRFGLLAMAIALIAASAIPANAQQIYKATFDLPFESQWGNSVVEPGQYTITVEEAMGQKLIRLHGAAELSMFANPAIPEARGENGRLTFVNVNGLYTLKAFSAAAIGQAFIFPVHKTKDERAQITTVSVRAD